MTRPLFWTTFGFTIGIVACLAAGAALRQDAALQPPGMDDDAMAMVQALKAAHDNPMEPGDFHRKLEHFIGEWDLTLRMFMGPGAPAIESKGTAEIEWMLGGRFTVERINAQLDMGGMTMPFESLTITGYDNYRNVYVGNMYSGMSTEIVNYQGGVTPDGSTFTSYGTMHEPTLNVGGRMLRIVTTIIDPDHHTVEIYDLHAGEDYKPVEFVYERK